MWTGMEMSCCFRISPGTDDDVISVRLEDEVEIALLGKAISKLTKREQMIIRLRFGIGNREGREKTQKEVADLLGISQSYISRPKSGS